MKLRTTVVLDPKVRVEAASDFVRRRFWLKPECTVLGEEASALVYNTNLINTQLIYEYFRKKRGVLKIRISGTTHENETINLRGPMVGGQGTDEDESSGDDTPTDGDNQWRGEGGGFDSVYSGG